MLVAPDLARSHAFRASPSHVAVRIECASRKRSPCMRENAPTCLIEGLWHLTPHVLVKSEDRFLHLTTVNFTSRVRSP